MSIPNNEGIAATKKRCDSYIHKALPTKIMTTFIALILTLNNLVFNSNFYLQIKGCAMGKIALQHMQISSWLNLNKNTFIR